MIRKFAIALLLGSIAISAFGGIDEFADKVRNSPSLQSYKTPDDVRFADLIAKETVVKGIYSLTNPRTQKIILFASEDLRYVGDFRGWHEVQNATKTISKPVDKQRQLALDQQLVIDKLNLDDAIVYKFGKGERKYAMWTGLDCGHCRDLEQKLKTDASRYNATLYLFPGTITGDRHVIEAVRNIWCGPDPAGEWQSAMTDPKYVIRKIDTSNCSKAKNVNTGAEIATILRGHGTPLWIGSIDGESTKVGFPPSTMPEAQDEMLDALLMTH